MRDSRHPLVYIHVKNAVGWSSFVIITCRCFNTVCAFIALWCVTKCQFFSQAMPLDLEIKFCRIDNTNMVCTSDTTELWPEIYYNQNPRGCKKLAPNRPKWPQIAPNRPKCQTCMQTQLYASESSRARCFASTHTPATTEDCVESCGMAYAAITCSVPCIHLDKSVKTIHGHPRARQQYCSHT